MAKDPLYQIISFIFISTYIVRDTLPIRSGGREEGGIPYSTEARTGLEECRAFLSTFLPRCLKKDLISTYAGNGFSVEEHLLISGQPGNLRAV